MIFMTSRYSDGQLLQAQDYARGIERLVVYRKWPTRTTTFSRYTWRDGDRPDLVALQFYGSTDAWWQIMDANPEISDPTSILPGTEIRLPS